MRSTFCFALTCFLATVCSGQTFITTLAGSNFKFPATALPAINAPLGVVTAVAADSQGNVYVADTNNNRVFRIDSRGTLTVYAGNGVSGHPGDGGPATSAALSGPQGLAFDSSQDLYICDTGNFRIRKVSPAGIITTFAGSGRNGFAGDGGPPTSAAFGTITRIAIDGSDNVYISDSDNHRIRRISTGGGAISTFAGNGTPGAGGDGGPALQASLRAPQGLAFDTAGNLYFADSAVETVRKINLSGIISTVAGTPGFFGEGGDGGPAAHARLHSPSGVALDQNSNLYIADSGGSRIRQVSPLGTISTIAGSDQVGIAGDGGPASAASLFSPLDLAFTPAGALLVADSQNFRVRSIANGVLSTIAGNGNYSYSGDRGPATNATLPAPSGLVIDGAGNITICDNFANRVRVVNAFGIINLTAGSSAPGFSGDGGPATLATFADCDGIARDSSGNLYIADAGNNRIRKINTAGIVSTVAGNGANAFSGDGGLATAASLSGPQGVVVDPQGDIYIADTGNERIRKVSPAGIISTIAGDGNAGFSGEGVASTSTRVNFPTRMALDASGNLYFSDSGNNLVRRISTSGTINTVAGNPSNPNPGFSGDGGPATSALLSNPHGIAIGPAGALLIADAGNGRIRRVDNSGNISTIAGNGTSTLSGDGRPPLDTGFAFPSDVAIDGAGNIYVTDRNNSRVRVIQPVPASLVVSQTGITFSAAVDAAALSTHTFRILNGGAGTIGWSAIPSTVSGGANWLSLSPALGTATSSAASLVTVTADPSGLAAGDYYGQIQIVSPGVSNSPRFITVVLNVLSPAQTTGPVINPAGLVFTGNTGGSNLAAQTLTVSMLHGSSVSFTSSIAFNQSAQWIAMSASANTIAIGKPATITLTPSITGLATGLYTATLNLNFSSGAARSVPLTLTLGSATPGGPQLRARATATCNPTQLVPVVTALGSGFTAPAGWPVAIEAQVVDDCGHGVNTGTVVAQFSNNDPPLALASTGSGTWDGTWEPRTSAASVAITVTAQSPPPAPTGTVKISGQVSPNAEPPILGIGGIVNHASYSAQNAVSPGAMISLFGTNLAISKVQASSPPLPTTLGGTRVLIGGIPIPLIYVGPGQIDAVAPFELSVGSGQVIVQSGTALSVPEPTPISAAGPGAFFFNDSSAGGSISAIAFAQNLDGSDYHLVTAAAPAHPGQALVIFCTGLGGVQTSVRAGDAAPDAPLANASEAVSVTLAGMPAQVLFAGLAPEFTGLYQVDAIIPAGVTGNAVPLALTSSGVAGPTVNLAIQ